MPTGALVPSATAAELNAAADGQQHRIEFQLPNMALNTRHTASSMFDLHLAAWDG